MSSSSVIMLLLYFWNNKYRKTPQSKGQKSSGQHTKNPETALQTVANGYSSQTNFILGEDVNNNDKI